MPTFFAPAPQERFSTRLGTVFTLSSFGGEGRGEEALALPPKNWTQFPESERKKI